MSLLIKWKNKFIAEPEKVGMSVLLLYPIINSIFLSKVLILYKIIIVIEIIILALSIIFLIPKNFKKVFSISIGFILVILFEFIIRGNTEILILMKNIVISAYLPLIFICCSKSSKSLLQLIYSISPLMIYILSFSIALNFEQYIEITGNWLGYQVLFPYTFLLYNSFNDSIYAKKNIPAFLFGLILLFFGGTRTPLLLCMLMITISLARLCLRKSKKIFYLFSSVLIFGIAIFFPLMKLIDNFLLNNGIIIRTIHIFSELNIFSLFNFSNRGDSFYLNSIKFIMEKPLTGYGLAQDRINICNVLNNKVCSLQNASGYYSHNLFLELLHEFGLILGTILIFSFVYSVYWLIKNHKVIFPFFICCFIPLMLSASWIEYMPFWIYIGYFYLTFKESDRRLIHFGKFNT